MSIKTSLGIIGARGHVGAELIRLVSGHPSLELAFVSSRELDGQRVADHNAAFAGELRYENLDPQAAAARAVDALVLALPNGKAAPFVESLDSLAPVSDGRGSQTVIIDLSADYRFDPAWYYGLPELTRHRYRGQTRIANPGCYATAMQLAIAPLKGELAGPPQCFGVSGYSGAGTTPSDKNNLDLLRDNLMPYSLTDHMHEREVTAQLGVPVEFMPHVAPHFRGITMTVNLWLRERMSREAIRAKYLAFYADESLIEIQDDAPWVTKIAHRNGVIIGGFVVAPDGRRVVVVSVLDNLLKGAASQALQNLNLAFGFDELTGISA